MLRYAWACSCCNRQHDELPLAFATAAPLDYYGIPEAEREARTLLTDDMCTIDDRAFYIRGCLEIPIIGHDEPFSWGLWVSVSGESMALILETWEAPDRASHAPRFGWLSATLNTYPEILNLKTMVHLRTPPTRPFIELEPTDHPLAVEQRQGITIERVVEIAEAHLPRH
ncbi:DUF2199 domain-containing protein [Inquilinus sp. YAF38]|uniref:DUF2199 domain-containing protein n=1 Tax=Inquilinus sp. YAF38 TaxID=3233084 RepID=UPI003F93DEA5